MSDKEKKRSINRLKSMYPLRDLMDKNYKAAQEAKEEGRPVAWCMLSIPTAILTAMGVEAVCRAGGPARRLD